MTELSREDQVLLEGARSAQSTLANQWPVSLGWKPSWIGTGVDSGRPETRWQCQNLRTVIFVHLDENDSDPDKSSRWSLPYTEEKGFGDSIDRNAPPISSLFHDLIQVMK